MSDITVAGLPIQTTAEATKRMSGLIWGPAGSGKTTLLSTAPGKKLWINFDEGGLSSVATRDDIVAIDFAGQGPDILDKIRNDTFGGVTALLDAHPDIETIVIDSLTELTQLSQYKAIAMGGIKNMTLETPGLPGYGRRNIIMLDAIRKLMSIAAKKNKHFFATAHEADPTTNDDGVVLYISVMLGGQITNNMSLKLSEIWHLNDTGTERRICVRPARNRKPMKTRMFDASKQVEFKWTYDALDPVKTEHMTIAHWYNQWRSGNGKKLELPK